MIVKFSKALLIASLAITLIGVLTGRYFFLLLLLPAGLFGFGKKKKEEEEDSF